MLEGALIVLGRACEALMRALRGSDSLDMVGGCLDGERGIDFSSFRLCLPVFGLGAARRLVA